MNEKYWLQDTNNYQATIKQQVEWINSLNMDVILDLHWPVGATLTTLPINIIWPIWTQYNFGQV